MVEAKSEILNLVEKYIGSKIDKFEEGVTTVQYSGPTIDYAEYRAVIETVLEGWLGFSKKASDFEKKMVGYLGKRYGIYVNSGSSANLIALETMKEIHCADMSRNKIIVPASSFPTTVNPVVQLGFEPVFVDINLSSYDPVDEQVMDALEDSSVIGMIFAHSLGIPTVNTKKYFEILKDRGGFLIEDCCDSLGSTYENGDLVGTYCDVATTSFYAAHHITTGEGGFAAFNSKRAEIIARSYRDWGRGCFCDGENALSKVGACKNRFSDWLDNGVITDHRYVYDRIGYNLKPLELQAAMGLEQLKKIDFLVKRRKENFAILDGQMKKYESYFILPKAKDGTDPSWFAYPITVRDEAPFLRHDIVKFLEDHKIQTRNFFAGNLLEHPAYRKKKFVTKYALVNSSKITNQTFMIGVYPGITEEMYRYIFRIFEMFFRQKNIIV
jgi:CDP-6-deoxy-D-xylo-4-hexulose-3-dehydrase